MKEFRVNIETDAGIRWFLVEASSIDNARTEAAVVVAENGGRLRSIDETWEEEFDLPSHIDS